MGFIEDKIKEIESEKVDFLQELEERIDRLKKKDTSDVLIICTLQ